MILKSIYMYKYILLGSSLPIGWWLQLKKDIKFSKVVFNCEKSLVINETEIDFILNFFQLEVISKQLEENTNL